MKTKFIKIKFLLIAVCIFQTGLSYAQVNNTKKLLIGKWTTSKVEASPEVQKEYNDWKQKVQSTKDKNEKDLLNSNIDAFESVLSAFIGMSSEFKEDGTSTVEVPNFSSTEPKLAVKGKWKLSADTKKLTITTKDKKPEYEIVSINEKELIYTVGTGPGMRTFYMNRK